MWWIEDVAKNNNFTDLKALGCIFYSDFYHKNVESNLYHSTFTSIQVAIKYGENLNV